jgi:hypothetical protein
MLHPQVVLKRSLIGSGSFFACLGVGIGCPPPYVAVAKVPHVRHGAASTINSKVTLLYFRAVLIYISS